MKNNRRAILIGEIGLVIACAGGFYVVNQNQIQPTEVYVFAKDIPVNTQITANDIKKVTIPATAVSKDFVRDYNKEVVGKYINTKVFAGEYVSVNKLVQKTEIDPFESIDLTKLRKISLPINFVDGLGGNLKRGDKVDMLYVGGGKKASTTGEKEYIYSNAFLQDVLVYSVTTDDGFNYEDKTQAQKTAETGGKDISTGGEGGKLSTITLAVTLDQAEQISARMKSGQIRLVGRFADSQNYDSPGYIIGDYNKMFTGEGLAESNK